MTIKKHEDKYIHINKEKLGTILLFGLIGLGLIWVSIWSGIEVYNNSRGEAQEYCFEKYNEGYDYFINNPSYESCKVMYLPIAQGIASIILFLIGIITIFIGLSEVSGNE